MKYLLSISAIIFFLFSCKKENALPHDDGASAHIESAVTNEPIVGAAIIVEVLSEKPGIGGPYYQQLDSFSVKSDDEGNVHFNIHYNNDSFISVRFFCFDSLTTGLLNSKTEFSLEDFKQQSPFTFIVRQLEKLDVTVKTVNNYNNDDAIDVDVVNANDGSLITNISSIQNFGTENQPLEVGNFLNYTNPYWKGNRVNSIIHAILEEGTTYKVHWNIKKDGVNTDYYSDTFKTQSNTLNTYTILY